MKTLLIFILVSMCIIAWRSDDVVDMVQGVSAAKPMVMTGTGTTILSAKQSPVSISIERAAETGWTSPHATRVSSDRPAQKERTDMDKMSNFLAHGKYE